MNVRSLRSQVGPNQEGEIKGGRLKDWGKKKHSNVLRENIFPRVLKNVIFQIIVLTVLKK